MLGDAAYANDASPPVACRPPRVAVGMRLPLVQRAVSALVDIDLRFSLATTPLPSGDAPLVALVDSARAGNAPHPLLASAAVTGFVLVTQAPSTTGLSHDRCGNLPKIELPITAPWDEVADALLRVAGDASAGSNGRRANWGEQRVLATKLTRREREVLQLIAAGLSVPEMARTLHLADSTIDNHRTRLLQKLGVKKSVDAARFAYRLGLATP